MIRLLQLALFVPVLPCPIGFAATASAAAISPAARQEPAPEPSDAVDTAALWRQLAERRLAQRRERGDREVCRFRGEFVGGGLPQEPTEVIPLDTVDIRFMLTVRVHEVLEGELPESWTNGESPADTVLVFGVHSPALFFRLHGIPPARGQHYPTGPWIFGVWRQGASGRLELEVSPLAEP